MKLIKLTQWIEGKTKLILVNPEEILTIEQRDERPDKIPILGESKTYSLTHIIFKGGTQGRLVTETIEEVWTKIGAHSTK